MTTPLSGVPWTSGIDDRTAAVDANNHESGGGGLVTIDDPSLWAADSRDYEFNATSSSLPTDWAWVNQGSASYSEAQGKGRIVIPATANVHTRGIFRPFTGAGTVTAHAVSAHASGDTFGLLLLLREEATTEVGGVRFFQNRQIDAIVADDDDGLNFSSFAGPFVPDFWPTYFQVVRHSASNVDLKVSGDGVAWLTVIAGWDASLHFTPDQIGVAALSQQDREFSIDWVRFT